MAETQTITITNFSGRLTRIVNGDLNSGFAKFTNSWGYDPFSKPMNLTWLEQPTSIAGISDLVLATKNRNETLAVVYGVGSTGKAYRILPIATGNPALDSVVGVGSVTAGSVSYTYGASIEFFGTPEKMYIGADQQIATVPLSNVMNGTFGGQTVIGNTNNFATNSTRPLAPFAGKLLFGNGPTVGAVGTTGTITSSIIGMSVGASGTIQNLYSELNPPLPPELSIKDLDISPDYAYLYMTSSDIPAELITTVSNDRLSGTSGNSNVAKWNGSDAGITAGTNLPAATTGALQTYLQKNLLFSNDPFGMSLGTEVQKTLTLQNNKVPFRNATGVNGNYVYWAAPEITGGSIVGALYYFGSLDQENPSGLYRLMRYNSTQAGGYIYQVPVATLINNQFQGVNNAINSIAAIAYGKHYLSVMDINTSTTTNKLLRFFITPSGTAAPQQGVYETQTQLFSKRIGTSQIRVYTEPTVSGNAFQLDLIGSDGTAIPSGTYTYTYGDIVDPQTNSPVVERINFPGNIKSQYALGVRITNLGTVNMNIKKVEIDYSEEGK